ncbi:SubName: Full=Uncharacterized protein {ECO:0000313/EMBL:CCA67934.1} [Serendipita indica DSM 11827]|uniref:SHSP domain-containing protein n=1 Tax=Serendipita indica (strain DSM 11827) TaxID=1109443 RepID=G4T9F6_SERID|nr:SubName: Full=Uncharacterized protein {ECO:0000313/EMBL:CCA67934.1} [Serendipita indica DSM 11827]CCA67934.1 hypothetical protein PIIN_01803 [Serendipita indica DSM 11827]
MSHNAHSTPGSPVPQDAGASQDTFEAGGMYGHFNWPRGGWGPRGRGGFHGRGGHHPPPPPPFMPPFMHHHSHHHHRPETVPLEEAPEHHHAPPGHGHPDPPLAPMPPPPPHAPSGPEGQFPFDLATLGPRVTEAVHRGLAGLYSGFTNAPGCPPGPGFPFGPGGGRFMRGCSRGPFGRGGWSGRAWPGFPHHPHGPIHPDMDIVCSDETFTVTVELPGLQKKDVDISVKDNVLTISGEFITTPQQPDDTPEPYDGFDIMEDDAEEVLLEKEGDKDDDDKKPKFILHERRAGKFRRCIRLPPWVDVEKIKATMADGVLTLVIQKPEPEKGEPARKISIL